MKTQMKFQKYICLVMLVLSALGLLYAFAYLSGGMAELGQARGKPIANGEYRYESAFHAGEGMNDYRLFEDIQPFNDLLMYCGIAMILLTVLLYVMACNKRRNYYVTNYVATGVCAGGNIAISLALMIMNASWRAKFLQVDFKEWKAYNDIYIEMEMFDSVHYSESTLWFDLGFVVYSLIIVASILLVLNLVWKVLLMKGEKKLLSGATTVEGGAAV